MKGEERVARTPTPWIVSQIFRNQNKLLITQLSGERNIAHIEWDGGEQEICGKDDANAAFIVTACNVHEALVDALRALLMIAEGCIDIAKGEGCDMPNAQLEIVNARAALSLATEGTR